MRFAFIGTIATAIIIGATVGGGGGVFQGPTTHLCAGTSYFVDFASGSDAANGTTQGTPWKHAPGMVGATGTASGHVMAAHDCFYFKGGVTWTSSFPLRPSAGGDVTADVYYGPRQGWFTGAAWTQPIFDSGSANIGGTTGVNAFFDLRSGDHFTVDNFHLAHYTGASWAGTFGTCAAVEMQGDQAVTVENLLEDNINVDATSDGNGCKLVEGAGFGSFSGTSVVENSVFTAAGAGTTVGGIYCLGNVVNNYFNGLTGNIFPCGHGDIGGNTISNCGYPSFPNGVTSYHADAIQSDAADGTFYIHDNVIFNTGRDATNSECEAMLIGNAGETDIVWNNVLYNLEGNGIALVQNATAGVAYKIWNNTLSGGGTNNTIDYSGYCIRDGHSGFVWPVGIVQNNHCLSSVGTLDPAQVTDTTSLTIDHNVLQTSAAAAAQGYTTSQTPFVLFPTTTVQASSATVDAGTDLSANCSGSLASLCSDTTYAVNPAANFGTAAARTAVARTVTWDAGAYESH